MHNPHRLSRTARSARVALLRYRGEESRGWTGRHEALLRQGWGAGPTSAPLPGL